MSNWHSTLAFWYRVRALLPRAPRTQLVLVYSVPPISWSRALDAAGIEASNDKLLQGRIFSYSDTQRYRLGANYLNLPINRPRNSYHNNHYDGDGNNTLRNEEVRAQLAPETATLCVRTGSC